MVQYVNDADAGGSHTFIIELDPDGTGTGVGGWMTSNVALNSEIGKPLSVKRISVFILLGFCTKHPQSHGASEHTLNPPSLHF